MLALRRLRAILPLALGLALASTPVFAEVSAAVDATIRRFEAGLARPNIIFILADDLGYGDVGCYGQTRIKTPRLDRLAEQGMRFTQVYAGSTVCAPSRCALMTGMHGGRGFIRSNSVKPLRPEDVTVAEMLKRAGYATALIGKWALGDPGSTGVPNAQGFDSSFGFLNQGHAHDYYTDHLFRDGAEVAIEGNRNGAMGEYVTDLFSKEALEYVRGRAAKPGEPFFLYLALTTPHANNEYAAGAGKGNGQQVPSDAPYSGESWPQAQKNYAAMITRMDGDIGRLMDLLDETGMRGNTIVFFSSDNGPHKEGGADPAFFKSAGPFSGYKRSLTDGGIRVPMIVSWPGRIDQGGASDAVYAFWDFMPTAIELAGPKAYRPEGLDGISMLPALMGAPKPPQHEYLYWEFHERGFEQAIRRGPWKALRDEPGDPIRLYDVTLDPAEKTDLASAHPDVIRELVRNFAEARVGSPDWPLPEPKAK